MRMLSLRLLSISSLQEQEQEQLWQERLRQEASAGAAAAPPARLPAGCRGGQQASRLAGGAGAACMRHKTRGGGGAPHLSRAMYWSAAEGSWAADGTSGSWLGEQTRPCRGERAGCSGVACCCWGPGPEEGGALRCAGAACSSKKACSWARVCASLQGPCSGSCSGSLHVAVAPRGPATVSRNARCDGCCVRRRASSISVGADLPAGGAQRRAWRPGLPTCSSDTQAAEHARSNSVPMDVPLSLMDQSSFTPSPGACSTARGAAGDGPGRAGRMASRGPC
jgi:hypothetical protein